MIASAFIIHDFPINYKCDFWYSQILHEHFAAKSHPVQNAYTTIFYTIITANGGEQGRSRLLGKTTFFILLSPLFWPPFAAKGRFFYSQKQWCCPQAYFFRRKPFTFHNVKRSKTKKLKPVQMKGFELLLCIDIIV